MSVAGDDYDLSLDSIFTEPPEPPAPEPTLTVYTREIRPDHSSGSMENDPGGWANIEIRLVGTHPLWGHYLWNAARSFASYLDANAELYQGRSVLELGAGGGLPGIVAAKNGAQMVVLTDYPDNDLIKNMEHNVAKNLSVADRNHISVQGYIWGRSVQSLLDALPSSTNSCVGFDLIILSDLIFNHSQHDALLETCELSLAPVPRPQALQTTIASPSAADSKSIITQLDWTPLVLVFYTHHRPHLAHRDLEFFTRARQRGWKCDEIVTRKFPVCITSPSRFGDGGSPCSFDGQALTINSPSFQPMFPDDPGEEEIRSTVHGWMLTRQPPLIE